MAEQRCRWHLQVAHREWVVWWYGPAENGNGHVAQATHLALGAEIPFTLPEHRPTSGLKPPEEVRRVTCWGWRFRTNDGIHDSGWRLAETRDECVTSAKVYLGRSARGDQSALAGAVDDVREYLTGLW